MPSLAKARRATTLHGLIFGLCLLIGQSAFAAKIYKFTHVGRGPGKIARPVQAFPDVERVYRVKNLTLGAPFSSIVSEFKVQDGKLQRLQSQKIDHVLEMTLETILENLRCEALLSDRPPKTELGPGEAWREATFSPIDGQALQEMNSRDYISDEQLEDYAASTNADGADRMIYLESLSWLTSVQTLEVFGGEIPWARVSEIEAPEGLSTEEIRALAQAGSADVRLRVRRATLRIASSISVNKDHKNQLSYSTDELPFEVEYKAQGVELPTEGEGLFQRYELGRGAQIAGLEGEAEKLSAMAGLLMWHHTLATQDTLTGKKTDIRTADAFVYLHALKRTHKLLYMRHFGAEVFAEGKTADDIVLRVNLRRFLHKTLGTLGLDAEALRTIAIKADAANHLRRDFDWYDGEQLLTRRQPLTIRASQSAMPKLLEKYVAADGITDQQRTSWIAASKEVFPALNDYDFPVFGAHDPFNQDRHGSVQADYFVSGLDFWFHPDAYVPRLLATLLRYFAEHGDATKIAIVVPRPEGIGGNNFGFEFRKRGFQLAIECQLYEVPHGSPCGADIAAVTVGQLKALAATDPLINQAMNLNLKLDDRTWGALRDLSLLPGL